MLTRIEISRPALHHNVSFFRKVAPQSRFLAVVKSNAYGHGLKELIPLLKGHADWFGVNSLEEAFAIRRLDPSTPVLVMGALQYLHLKSRRSTGENPAPIYFVVSTIEEIQELSALDERIPFHLKVDTGMSRLGTDGSILESVFRYLEERPDLPWAGLMTHFANVEDVTDQGYARRQLDHFLLAKERALEAARGRELLFHTAASAAAMLLPESRQDMIRVGISLYGLWPSDTTRISLLSLTGSVPELMPVLRWVTTVVHVNRVAPGICVGYGCTYRTQEETLVAVLPVGYFEGYERSLSNRSHVLIRGRRARLLGRVCMNMIMVDVTHIPGVSVGDEAVLIGSQGAESVSAEELAGLTSTINYEVVTRIQQEIPRVVVDGL